MPKVSEIRLPLLVIGDRKIASRKITPPWNRAPQQILPWFRVRWRQSSGGQSFRGQFS